jgi:hypothetical protein
MKHFLLILVAALSLNADQGIKMDGTATVNGITCTLTGVIELPPALIALAPAFKPYTLVFAQTQDEGALAFTLLWRDENGQQQVSTQTARANKFNSADPYSAGTLFRIDPRSVIGVSVARVIPIASK